MSITSNSTRARLHLADGELEVARDRAARSRACSRRGRSRRVGSPISMSVAATSSPRCSPSAMSSRVDALAHRRREPRRHAEVDQREPRRRRRGSGAARPPAAPRARSAPAAWRPRAARRAGSSRATSAGVSGFSVRGRTTNTLPGCGSAWKMPVDRDPLQVGARELVGHRREVVLEARERRDRRRPYAAHALRRQHALAWCTPRSPCGRAAAGTRRAIVGTIAALRASMR